jgi:hypothetical protein
MKLYEISNNIQELINMIDDISNEAFIGTMESLQFELHEKAENYAKVIKTIELEVDGLEKEVARLSTMKSARTSKIEYLKKAVEEAMILADDKKFKTDLFSFNVQKNNPSLDISDEAFIPVEYYILQDPKLDRKKLLDSVKNGLQIDGVNIKQTESLRIK